MRISDWSSVVCSSDLAAGADAVVELHVVADHLHLGHHIGAVADEGGALHRRAHLAVLDEVGLGAGEHELARGDVDQTGRASCRGRVCQYGSLSVVAVPLRKKT